MANSIAAAAPFAEHIRAAASSPDFWIVVGDTKPGKTTLTIDYMPQCNPHDRIVIIENTDELQTSAKPTQYTLRK